MSVRRADVVSYDDLLDFGLSHGYDRVALLALWRLIPRNFVQAIPEVHRMVFYTAKSLTPWDKAQPVQRDEGIVIERASLLNAAEHIDVSRLRGYYGPRRRKLFEAWVRHLRRAS